MEPMHLSTREEADVPKILVIDDDPAVRRLVEDVLELEGYEVRTAEDGFAGLRAIEALRPDCVVLDIMMPGMDGHAVLQRIRSAAGRHLPVVMLTAAADDSQAWQAWTEGVDYFLAKPFEPEELLRFLDYLFEAAAPVAG
jgi:DNA-binding response OmpR family regulator